jgi:hypothetical protein
MDVISLAKIKADFPSLRFIKGRKFAFRPPRTIVTPENFSEDEYPLLLHELGHALVGRFDFKTEIERLQIEVLAWEKARELAASYEIEIDENLIQGELDTYRDWLHQKSRCPNCGLTRFQTPDGVFRCPKCDIIS